MLLHRNFFSPPKTFYRVYLYRCGEKFRISRISKLLMLSLWAISKLGIIEKQKLSLIHATFFLHRSPSSLQNHLCNINPLRFTCYRNARSVPASQLAKSMVKSAREACFYALTFLCQILFLSSIFVTSCFNLSSKVVSA